MFAACILSHMPSKGMFRESRRSARVPLKVAIAVESGAESLTCEGETVVVNLHGALLSTTIGLSVGMRISIHVYLTDKRAKARVVYADPENPPALRHRTGSTTKHLGSASAARRLG